MLRFYAAKPPHARKRGGIALEYIIVSAFTAVITISALAFMGTVIKKQLSRMAEKMGVRFEESDWTDPFSE